MCSSQSSSLVTSVLQDLCFGAATHFPEQTGVVLPAGDDLWVPRPQGLCKDGQRPFVHRLGLGVLSVVFVEHGQVVECHRHVGMTDPKEFLLDCKGAPVEPFGLRALSLCLFERRQIIQVDGDLVVFRTVFALEDVEHVTVDRAPIPDTFPVRPG